MPFAQGPPHQQVAPSSQQVVTSSGPDSPIGPPSSDTFVRLFCKLYGRQPNSDILGWNK